MIFDEVYKYMVGTFIIGCGFFIGFKLVDKFVYQRMINDSQDGPNDTKLTDTEVKEKNIDDYSINYLEEYTNLKSVKLNEDDYKRLMRCFLIEDTPLGTVKMYYSNEDGSFIYWSERQVPYKVLETVSRKYVIDYDCRSIHVNMEDELDKQRKLLMDMKNANELGANELGANELGANELGANELGANELGAGKTSVFANFKKYNTGGSNTTTTKTGNKTKNVIVCDNANRYSYRGVYDENKNVVNKFNDTSDTPDEESTETNKMSISAYLKYKKEYESRCDNMNSFQDESSSGDGLWRFLNINYIDLSNNTIEQTDKGEFWINGKRYSSRIEYHSDITAMNTIVGSGDKDSDNSYDVLENDTNEDDLVESGIRKRTNSIASSGELKTSWLGW